MGCPPVRGDNPRALASGLSYVQVDKHSITICTTYISVDLAHHEIFCAKVGKGGINDFNWNHANDLWHFGSISAYFSDSSNNFPMLKISLVSS